MNDVRPLESGDPDDLRDSLGKSLETDGAGLVRIFPF